MFLYHSNIIIFMYKQKIQGAKLISKHVSHGAGEEFK